MSRLLTAAALLAAGLHGAGGWETYGRAASGYAIALPAGWQVVPQSTTALRARAAQASKAHETALAEELTEIVATRRTEPAFSFHAFRWPAPSGPVVPDVTVKIDALEPATTSADLKAIAAGYVRALRRANGAKVGEPARVLLPAGPAERITGTVPLGKSGPRSAYTVYLFVRPRRLFSLTFRDAAAHAAADAGPFRQIAARLRLL